MHKTKTNIAKKMDANQGQRGSYGEPPREVAEKILDEAGGGFGTIQVPVPADEPVNVAAKQGDRIVLPGEYL